MFSCCVMLLMVSVGCTCLLPHTAGRSSLTLTPLCTHEHSEAELHCSNAQQPQHPLSCRLSYQPCACLPAHAATTTPKPSCTACSRA